MTRCNGFHKITHGFQNGCQTVANGFQRFPQKHSVCAPGHAEGVSKRQSAKLLPTARPPSRGRPPNVTPKACVRRMGRRTRHRRLLARPPGRPRPLSATPKARAGEKPRRTIKRARHAKDVRTSTREQPDNPARRPPARRGAPARRAPRRRRA